MKLLTSLFRVLFSRSTSSSLDTSYQRETKLKRVNKNSITISPEQIIWQSTILQCGKFQSPLYQSKNLTMGNIPNLLLKVISSYFCRKIEKQNQIKSPQVQLFDSPANLLHYFTHKLEILVTALSVIILSEHVKATKSWVKGNGTQELRRPVQPELYPVLQYEVLRNIAAPNGWDASPLTAELPPEVQKCTVSCRQPLIHLVKM